MKTELVKVLVNADVIDQKLYTEKFDYATCLEIAQISPSNDYIVSFEVISDKDGRVQSHGEFTSSNGKVLDISEWINDKVQITVSFTINKGESNS